MAKETISKIPPWAVSLPPAPPGITFVENKPCIRADDPIALTSYVCKAFPLNAINPTCPTFVAFQGEVSQLARDQNFQTEVDRLLSSVSDPALERHLDRVGMLYEYALASVLGDELVGGFKAIGSHHDLGKVMDDKIHRLTLEPRKLTKEEMEVVQRHVVLVGSLLKEYPRVWQVAAGHHEFGQLHGYRREAIHADESGWQTLVPFRVWLSACDKADAWVSPRPDRGPKLLNTLPEYLSKWCGYSDEIVEAITTCMPRVNQQFPILSRQ